MPHEMKTITTWHWGDWVWARASSLGFRRQSDLARAISCAPERMCRQLKLASPPPRMRKGFDEALARVLMVDRRMLFTDFAKTDPASLPMIVPPESGDKYRREIIDATYQLGVEKLRALSLSARAMLPGSAA